MNPSAASMNNTFGAVGRSIWRGLAFFAVLAVCVQGSTAALAQRVPALESRTGPAIDAPWDPDATLSIYQYLRSPSFNDRRDYVDHFNGPAASDEVGLAAAELSNGDILVAGLVPDYQGAGTCSNGTALCNVGLVRYSRHGVREPWPDPASSGFDGNNYVIYPNNAATGFEYLRDVKVHNGTIYVLLDVPNAAQSGLGRQDVVIASFFENGRSRGNISVFGLSSNASDTEDFYGAQMTFTSGGHMIVTATDYDGTSSYLAVSRLLVSDSGTLNQDPTWGTSYAGSGNRIIRYPANVPYTTSYAVNQVGFATQDDFFVAGNIEDQGDSDVLVLKISSVTGSYKPEFGGGGFVSVDFANPNSTHDDYAGGLYVYQDDVYLAAQVAGECLPAAGVARINGATGALVSAFGSGGKVVFGNTAGACGAFAVGSYPVAMSATGGRLGLAGYRHAIGPPPAPVDDYDPFLAIVDAVDGTPLDFGSRRVVHPDRTRAGDGAFYGIFGGPSPFSPFVVAGNSRDTLTGNTLSYLTGMYVPASDLIFADNFETYVP
jgi:hypothetical protein